MNRYVTAATALLALAYSSIASTQARSLDAEIRWTRFGVPHVKAADYASLGFGYGYAVAMDELCILAEQVATLRGERSRWFGADGKAVVGFTPTSNLDSDLFYRVQMSVADIAAAARSLSAPARELTFGYAAGFNRFVRDMRPDARNAGCSGVPLPTMTSDDVLRFMMQISTMWRAQDIAAAASASTWENLTVTSATSERSAHGKLMSAPVGEEPIGSNAWAYGADVTGTGAAIVVANPHTAWTASWQRMHQLHLTIPGEIDVAGADFAGLPIAVAGFTRDVAWSIKSPIGVRYHVLLALDVRHGQQPFFVVDGQRRPIAFETVNLDVRDTVGSIRSRPFHIPHTDLGPIYQLAEVAGRRAGWYALTDANSQNVLGIDQMLSAAKARSIEEFERAIAGNRGITARLIAGDRHGKALYIESGPLLHVDPATLNGCVVSLTQWVFDGTRAACLLRTASGAPRLAPAELIPAVITRGAVQFASTSYRYALFDRLLDGYSPLLGDARQPPGARALMSQRHLTEVLSDGRVTLAEATDVMFSDRNYAAETSLDAILMACKLAADGSSPARACAMLATWDRRNNRDSRGALLFAHAWPRLRAIPNFHARSFDPTRPYNVAVVSNTDEVADAIVATLGETLESLEKSGLRGDEPWGRMLGRVTSGGRVELHGGSADEGVLNVITGDLLQSQGYADIRYGTSYAHVVTWEQGKLAAGVLLAHGQSIDPASAHFSDQLATFAAKQLMRLPFTDAEIEADPAYRVVRLRERVTLQAR